MHTAHAIPPPHLERLPSPPAVMQQIVRAAGNPQVPMQKLASLVSTDSGFTMELLRMANSPFYGASREIGTVRQATMVLGTRVIRNQAIAHIVRVVAQALDLGDFDESRFWEDSLRRGVAAFELANLVGYEDPQEAFTIGLIQDIGVMLAAAVVPQATGALTASMGLPSDQRIREERQHTGRSHPEWFELVVAEWSLPPDLVTAVAAHHDPTRRGLPRKTTRLVQIASVGDAIADIFQCAARGETVGRARTLLEALPSRLPATLEVVADAVEAGMPEMADRLHIRIGEQASFQSLLTEANESLVQITDSYEALTRRLQQALAEKEELARMLERTNAELQRLAATDPLTGVANRRRFLQVAEETLAEAHRAGEPLSLVLLDLDHFKRVNDTHGHGVGDDVLAGVARRLSTILRPTDLIGRVGGEEFAILLPTTPAAGGECAASRCQRNLAQRPIECRTGTRLRITASFGGATWEPGTPPPSVDRLLEEADHAMYSSKESGRNRVTWSHSQPR